MGLSDTWFARDLPVLEALVELLDAELFPLISLRSVAEKTGMDVLTVGIAARALDDAGLIDLSVTMTGGDPGPWHVSGVSAEARQLTGTWPTPEILAQRMLQALEREADGEGDPAKKQWLSRLLGGAGEVSRATAVEILSSVFAKVVTGI